MVAQQSLENKIYVAVEGGVSVERYSHAQMYEKLSAMNDFDRLNFIKSVNASYGYEVVNYKLLQQMYEQTPSEVVVKRKDDEMADFARDYTKAFMKMLSV